MNGATWQAALSAPRCLLSKFSPKPCLLSRRLCPPLPPLKKPYCHLGDTKPATCAFSWPSLEMLPFPSYSCPQIIPVRRWRKSQLIEGCIKGFQEQPLVPAKDLTKACFKKRAPVRLHEEYKCINMNLKNKVKP